MPEVPEHLVPADGLTNSGIRFAGMDAHENDGGATIRFDIDDGNGHIGTILIDAYPEPSGGVDAMIAQAYRGLTDILRQWLFRADESRQAYEKQAAG